MGKDSYDTERDGKENGDRGSRGQSVVECNACIDPGEGPMVDV